MRIWLTTILAALWLTQLTSGSSVLRFRADEDPRPVEVQYLDLIGEGEDGEDLFPDDIFPDHFQLLPDEALLTDAERQFFVFEIANTQKTLTLGPKPQAAEVHRIGLGFGPSNERQLTFRVQLNGIGGVGGVFSAWTRGITNIEGLHRQLCEAIQDDIEQAQTKGEFLLKRSDSYGLLVLSWAFGIWETGHGPIADGERDLPGGGDEPDSTGGATALTANPPNSAPNFKTVDDGQKTPPPVLPALGDLSTICQRMKCDSFSAMLQPVS